MPDTFIGVKICLGCSQDFRCYDKRQDQCKECDPDLHIRDLENWDATGVLDELIAEDPYGDEERRRQGEDS